MGGMRPVRVLVSEAHREAWFDIVLLAARIEELGVLVEVEYRERDSTPWPTTM